METNKFEVLKNQMQQIIDAIAIKNFEDASRLHTETSELLDEILDHLDDDADLITISKHQVLLNKLFEQII